MAKPEHLLALRAGVNLWNNWRRQNPSVQPDLSDTNLSGGRSYALDDPYDDYMNGADFQGANLQNSNLSGICMIGANFTCADLSGSRLAWSNLSGALFHHARLISASLENSTVICSNFTGAQFEETHLAGIDLSAAVGLETISHSLPSIIELSTLKATAKGLQARGVTTEQKGAIEHFLRRSGNADLLEFLAEHLRL